MQVDTSHMFQKLHSKVSKFTIIFFILIHHLLHSDSFWVLNIVVAECFFLLYNNKLLSVYFHVTLSLCYSYHAIAVISCLPFSRTPFRFAISWFYSSFMQSSSEWYRSPSAYLVLLVVVVDYFQELHKTKYINYNTTQFPGHNINIIVIQFVLEWGEQKRNSYLWFTPNQKYIYA